MPGDSTATHHDHHAPRGTSALRRTTSRSTEGAGSTGPLAYLGQFPRDRGSQRASFESAKESTGAFELRLRTSDVPERTQRVCERDARLAEVEPELLLLE